MDTNAWYSRLEKWAFDDERLHRLPLMLLTPLAEHLANWDAAIAEAETKTCTWRLSDIHDYDLWIMSCGNAFVFEDEGPVENGFAYCPYCGNKLIVVQGKQP